MHVTTATSHWLFVAQTQASDDFNRRATSAACSGKTSRLKQYEMKMPLHVLLASEKVHVLLCPVGAALAAVSRLSPTSNSFHDSPEDARV